MRYIIKCLSSYSGRTRIKSHLRWLKNIGMVSEQLFRNTFNVGRFVQLRRFQRFCRVRCHIGKPVPWSPYNTIDPVILRLVIRDPGAVIPVPIFLVTTLKLCWGPLGREIRFHGKIMNVNIAYFNSFACLLCLVWGRLLFQVQHLLPMYAPS